MSEVTIFAPSPILTVTVEDHADGSEIHVHAGGQGVWQARMLLRLGTSVTMCCVLSGEVGAVVRHLLEDEGITVVSVTREGRGAAYLHDRRSGERREVAAEPGDPLGRHDLDEIYGLVLGTAMHSRVTILSGPSGEIALPPDTYRRLAADLRAAGATVVVDLAGERLAAAVAGGVDLLKVSDEELEADGLIGPDAVSGVPREGNGQRDPGDVAAIIVAMRELRDRGAGAVIVTRAGEPLLLADEQGILEVKPPKLEVADHHGAGDSLLAGVVTGLARGEQLREATTLGAAAGALNVTRHGLGTGDADTVAGIRERVTARILDLDGAEPPVSGRVTPEGLALLAGPGTAARTGGGAAAEPGRSAII